MGRGGGQVASYSKADTKAWPRLVGHLAHNILVEGYGYWVGTSLLGGLADINSILMKVNIPRRNQARSPVNGNLVQPYTLYKQLHICKHRRCIPLGANNTQFSRDNALVAPFEMLIPGLLTP